MSGPRTGSNDKSLCAESVREAHADTLLADLYRNHFANLVSNIRKSFGSGPPDPEDVVQSAFAKYASLENPQEIKDPRSFIYIAARNLVLDHKRSAKVADAYIAEQIALDYELKLEGITPERVVVAKERFDILIEAMRALPRKQQVILAMSRLEGKSYREIGEEMGWSAGDISRNMKMAIASLVIALKRKRMIATRGGGAAEQKMSENDR
ncbi:RNA polymerase sigma factor [Hyphococcus luteus]|uniref:RNA polymerase sigma factor n=1 Tax=Hyphococcus luteus TaxID=2058213 RepID=UPI0013FD3B42|nr:sigma-70 family RNA polymerase sigma factor [Marinicaulis flavus]